MILFGWNYLMLLLPYILLFMSCKLKRIELKLNVRHVRHRKVLRGFYMKSCRHHGDSFLFLTFISISYLLCSMVRSLIHRSSYATSNFQTVQYSSLKLAISWIFLCSRIFFFSVQWNLSRPGRKFGGWDWEVRIWLNMSNLKLWTEWRF